MALLAVIAGGALAALAASPASAHEEREVTPPAGSGNVPEYRTEGPTLLVCKTDLVDFTERIAGFEPELLAANQALWEQCQASGFRDLQEAVRNVTQPGTIIKILPGIYLEEPSLAEPSEECANLSAPNAAAGYQLLSYEQQAQCPNNQNLVAIVGLENLQIEGTGASPEDVIIDAQFRKLVAIRADRANGIYLRNFTTQHTTLDGVYVLETDGFVIDTVAGRWNDEYGLRAVASDHGLVTDCEAYGNGFAGIATAALTGPMVATGREVERYAIEIRNCHSHDNLLGYAGSAGNFVWAHENRFVDNTVGVAADSAAPGQTNRPPHHALFERNVIANNNKNYYAFVRDGTCARSSPERGYDTGVVCPAVGVPPGTGVINAGGNDNTWRGNWVYGNTYAGFVLSWVPGFLRGDTGLRAQFDTSHHNRYYGNRLGVDENGNPAPNGMDFWWDGQGVGSCWQTPTDAGAEPLTFPRCGANGLPAGYSTARYIAEPAKVIKLYVCSRYDLASATLPSGCDWFGATGFSRIEVRFAAVEALLLGAVLIAVWWRVLRRSGAGFVGLLMAVAGLVVGVFGTLQEASVLTPIGLGLAGVGWLLLGVKLSQKRRPGLGFLTVAIGIFAATGAIDSWLYMLPFVPVPPSVWRMTLEGFWVLAAAIAALRSRRRRRAAAAAAKPKPTGDALESFTARLAAGGSW
ncbi:MAG: right-handed parallel beta-helix repeat-containing protein [Micromonosporaceae bacterium]|nr:right-handed parallel beta-helix repeat-containing protein [Micromonosporaceae bacterium]